MIVSCCELKNSKLSKIGFYSTPRTPSHWQQKVQRLLTISVGKDLRKWALIYTTDESIYGPSLFGRLAASLNSKYANTL